jgi:hypothetical protein
MSPDEEDSSTSGNDEEEEEKLASVALTAQEWVFIIGSLDLVQHSHHTQTKECRDAAYRIECRIIEGLAAR